MPKMGGIFQTVQEMRVNNYELNEIAESLGISRSLIDHLDTNEYDYSNYLYPSQSENFNDTSIFC